MFDKHEAPEEQRAREKWERYHRYMRIEEVDGMTGTEFERFIIILFERLGYRNVRGTPITGDQGADLVCLSPDSKRTVVQTKRWKGPVGNSAIQEVLGALHYYDAEVAFVISSSYFTEPAKALAKKIDHVHLVNRAELAEMMRKVFPREVPEFSWEEYNKHIAGWSEGYIPHTEGRAARRSWSSRRRITVAEFSNRPNWRAEVSNRNAWRQAQRKEEQKTITGAAIFFGIVILVLSLLSGDCRRSHASVHGASYGGGASCSPIYGTSIK